MKRVWGRREGKKNMAKQKYMPHINDFFLMG